MSAIATVQEQLVPADVVAEALAVKKETVLDLARRGVIPSVRINSKLIRFSLPAVLERFASPEFAQ